MKKKFLFKVALVALTMSMAVTAFAGCGKKKDNNTILLGCSGPLTGAAAVYGTAVQNSMQLAIDEINAKGGLSNGVKFALKAIDDKASGDESPATYAALKQAGVKLSIGCVTTGAFLAMKQYAVNDGLFVMAPSATGDDITQECDNIYQMCFADSVQGTVSAEYVNANVQVGTKIGALYRSDDDYSKGILANFEKTLSDEHKANYTKASFTGEKPTNLGPQVDILQDCTFIFMPIYYTPASTFMIAGNDIISEDAVYFGCDGLDGIDAIEGFDIGTIKQEVSMLSHFNSGATAGTSKTFIDAYKAKYGESTLNQFGASAYDCVNVFYQVLNKAIEDGKKVDGSLSVKEFCSLVKGYIDGGFVFKNGVTGSGADIKWNTNGTVNKSADKFQIKGKNVD